MRSQQKSVGDYWESIENMNNQQQRMETYNWNRGNQNQTKKSMGINRSQRESIGINGNQQKSMGINRRQWESIGNMRNMRNQQKRMETYKR